MREGYGVDEGVESLPDAMAPKLYHILYRLLLKALYCYDAKVVHVC